MPVKSLADAERAIEEAFSDEQPYAGLSGQNIICLAKDWGEDPTSCNHVMRELSKRNRVLWLNSISTRAPNLSSGRDIKKIFNKLASFLRGPKTVGEQMWVYTPIVVPLHHKKYVVSLNRLILRFSLSILRRKLGMKDFQLWTFVPTSAPYIGHLGAKFTVYYCTDNWSAFSFADAEKAEQMVEQVAQQSRIVFATSRPLVEKLKSYNSETHLAAHGVNYDLFAGALTEKTTLPNDLASLKEPVIGYYGLIEDWMDQELVAYLAERHPEWSIALVGRACVDVTRLLECTNVHLLGRKTHDQLPSYCKGFSVGLIPHKVNELTKNMNPIKLREYLSAGLPIVSTALPEVRHYAPHAKVTDTYELFEQAIVEFLETESSQTRRQRSDSMRCETWEQKVEELGVRINRVS